MITLDEAALSIGGIRLEFGHALKWIISVAINGIPKTLSLH